jgi:hypothetical protein
MIKAMMAISSKAAAILQGVHVIYEAKDKLIPPAAQVDYHNLIRHGGLKPFAANKGIFCHYFLGRSVGKPRYL